MNSSPEAPSGSPPLPNHDVLEKFVPGAPPVEPDEGAVPMKPNAGPPVGRAVPIPPRGAKAPGSAVGLALPHERDESTNSSAGAPDPGMVQAQHDIDAGMVDTDMRATPGLDARLRSRLVPGPGGKAPPSGG